MSNFFDVSFSFVSHSLSLLLHRRLPSLLSIAMTARRRGMSKLEKQTVIQSSVCFFPNDVEKVPVILHTLHSRLYTLHFTFYTPHFAVYIHSALYTLHSTLYTIHFTFHTLHSPLYTLNSTLHTLHSTLCTLYSTVYTLHSTLHTPHSTLSTPPSCIFHSLRCTGMVTVEKCTILFKQTVSEKCSA